MNNIRLGHYLAQCGIGSRRQCQRLITAGKVTFKGQVIPLMDASNTELEATKMRPLMPDELAASSLAAGHASAAPLSID